MNKFIYILFLSSVFIVSCSDDESRDKLDAELQKLMIEASPTNSIDFYKLPNPNDLKSIPQDPLNELTRDKVALGKLLYHETAFSTEGKFPITKQEYSCASCHHAGAGFQAGLAQGIAEGGEGFGINGEGRVRNLLCAPELCDVQPIRTPTILNGAFQPVMLWNGQFGATDVNTGTEDQWTPGTPKETNNLGFEGLEIQAIAGLEVHRIGYNLDAVIEHGYKDLFDKAFPGVSEDERYTRVTAGLAIAAYERTVMSYNAPFQKYLRGNTYQLSDAQKEGAILFFGKANCVACHTGPALNKMEFHALGLNEFNVDEVIHYDPEDPTRFGRFSFTQNQEDMFKFKTPQLYNLKGIEFLGHGSSLHSVREVIEYKNTAIAENSEVDQSQLADEFVPLGLSDDEIDKLTWFLEYALFDEELERFVPSSILSGNCFPNNDPTSQVDLGCK